MRLLLVLALASAVFAQTPEISNAKLETRQFSGDLASHVHGTSPAWFGYAVKAPAGEHESCCWHDGNRCGCALENESHRGSSDSRPRNPVPLEGSSAIAILIRVANSDVERVRVYSMACPLDAGGLSFVWLSGVSAGASLSYLEKLAIAHTEDKVLDGAVLAISQHDDSGADTALERLTRPALPENLREKAIFWIGASRGAPGLRVLKNLLAHEASEKIRDKAVFALSINKQPEALDTLISVARSDASPHVRSQAIFWLSQKAGQRASATISSAIENDPDTGVKERAVFALSQLPKDEGVVKLIQVARSQKNPSVRKQAFFWLGQSGDPRALAFIEQVLTK